MRSFLIVALVAGLASVVPAQAADVDKYLPEDAAFYVHVTTKNFLAAPVVRKAIPMAAEKYSDMIMMFAPLAAQNAPNVKPEDIKKGLAELKKPENIAMAFDTAKEFGPEIIVAGNPDSDPEKMLILIKCHEAVTPEIVDQFAPMVTATGQVKMKSSKSGKTTVYELSVPQQPQAFFAAVPEAGVICMGVKKEAVEGAVKGTGGKLDPTLKKLMSNRGDKDFVFAAGIKGKGDEAHAFFGSLVLDKDISGKMSATFGTAKEAQERGDELNQQVEKALAGLKAMLGDQAKSIKFDGMKATVNGKTVNFSGKIPGTVIEQLLSSGPTP